MTPQETLEFLKTTKNSRVNSRFHETLDAIYAVCTEQSDAGNNDFAVATIARLGEKRGVPKAQSINNKTGEPYKTLINAFAKATPPKKIKLNRSEQDWIDRIDDPDIKLCARRQSAKLKDAQKTIDEYTRKVVEVDLRSKKGLELNSMEKHALEFIVSPVFRSQEDLTLGNNGEILRSDGQVLLKVATMSAIDKVLKYL
jgi:hypothetical protein